MGWGGGICQHCHMHGMHVYTFIAITFVISTHVVLLCLYFHTVIVCCEGVD